MDWTLLNLRKEIAMSVGKICVRTVDSARPNESVWCIAERMHQRAVGALIVLDEAELPVGIVTDRDIVERVVAQGRDANLTRVADIMSENLHTVREATSIPAALAYMRMNGVRRLPVVDDSERLAGLVTLDDILILLAEELTEIGHLVERQTPQAIAEQ
jgi:CBS domain-containing protein